MFCEANKKYTWNLGCSWKESLVLTEDHYMEAEKAIETALEEGITFFDLADIYKMVVRNLFLEHT